MNAIPPTSSIIKQKRLISSFLSYDCTSIEKAKTLDDLGLKESHIFDMMESKGIFVKCSGNKYYFNERIWNRFRKTRIIFIAAVIIIVLVLVLTNVL